MMHTTCAYCSEHSSVPEMDDDNWDLSAVVRSCRPSPPQAEANSSLLFPPHSGSLVMVEGSKGGAFDRLAEVFEGRSGDREILEEQLHVPFFLKVQNFPQQESGSWSAISAAAAALPAIAMEGSDRALPRRKVGRPLCQTSRSRRRKIQQKKVVRHVAAEGHSSDLWSWRKYGQKPIKGSPYPRGYYKCSSSKGCPARKLVERSRMDPTVFIVTYTAEHNHPVPTLGGRTRHKLTSSPSGNKEASPLLTTSGPELSPTTHPATSDLVQPKQEEDWVNEEVEVEEDDDEGELLMEDMVVLGENDLLFESSEEGGTASAAAKVTPLFVGEGCCEDDLFPLQWLSHCNNAAEGFSAS